MDFARTLGTAASPTSMTASQNLGQLTWWGYDGSTMSIAGRLMVRSGENWTSTAKGSHLLLQLNPTGSSTTTEVLRITGDGKMGIGTNSPYSVLHIGTSATTSTIGDGLYLSNATKKLVLYNSITTGQWNPLTLTGDHILLYGDLAAANPTSGGLVIGPHSTAADEGVRIDHDGKVGIGVSSPAAKLDVAGEVKFGNTSSTCNATNEGQQRYNSTLKLMEFCNGTTWERVGARAVMPIIVTDEKAANTVGGNIVANTWTTRTLNTIKADPGGYVSLSSNQLTFAPGSYKCIMSAPSYKAQFHQIRWYNVTAGSVHAVGTQDHSEDTDWTGNRSFLHTYFQINASTTFRLEHIVNYPTGGSTGSLGVESPWTTGTFAVVDCLRLGY